MSPTVYMERLQEGLRLAILAIFGVTSLGAGGSLGATSLGAGSLGASESSTDLSVLWSPSERPRELTQSTLVALSLVAGPSWDDTMPAGETVALPQTATLTLTGAPGTIAVDATGARWSVLGTMDAETDRDNLLALLDPSTGDPAEGKRLYGTIAASGTDQITLAGADAKALYGLSVSGPVSLSIDTTAAAKLTYTDAIVRVGVQVYSTTRYPRGGAHQTLTRLLGGLMRNTMIDFLGSYGLELAALPTPPADLTSISGARWESRAASNLDFRIPWLDAETILPITSASLGLTTKGAGSDIATTVTVEAP